MKLRCHHCNKPITKSTGEINRAAKVGMNLYCNHRCVGQAKRTTKAEKVELKRLYDEAYRAKNRAALKVKKRAYFKRTYDPAKAAIERKKTMPRHVEYCRRPEYRVKKQAYDEKRRDSEYGAFAEAARLAINLNREIKKRMSNYEIRSQNKTLNKIQDRRREGTETPRDRNTRAQS